SITAKSLSNVISLGTAPAAPTTLTATLQAGPQIRLTWRDNATNEAGFVIQRSTDGVNFARLPPHLLAATRVTSPSPIPPSGHRKRRKPIHIEWQRATLLVSPP